MLRNLSDGTRKRITAVHKIPSAAGSQAQLKDLPGGFEAALWGKYAEDPEYWKKLSDKPAGIFSRSLGELSANPPPPLAKRMLKTFFHPATYAMAFALATISTPFLIDRSIGVAASQQNETPAKMPNDLSRIQRAHNKKVPGKDSPTYYFLEAVDPTTNIPRRFALGDPARANHSGSVPKTDPSTQYKIQNRLPYSGVAEIPAGDGSQLSSLSVTGADGKEWSEGADYELKFTPAGEAVIFPTEDEPYHVESGFTAKVQEKRNLEHPYLSELDHGRLLERAAELSEHGFAYLPPANSSDC